MWHALRVLEVIEYETSLSEMVLCMQRPWTSSARIYAVSGQKVNPLSHDMQQCVLES